MAHDDNPPLTDELLRALVDGELDPGTAARIESRLAQDARAALFVARERSLRQRLQAAYAPAAQEPVPERLLAALGRAPAAANDPAARVPAPDVAHARAGRQPGPARRWLMWWAMAASLALGVFVGQRLRPADGPMLALSGEQWVASSALASALDSQGAATQRPDAAVQLATSFVAQDGHYCRSFTLPHDGVAGLACRQGERWQMQVLARTEPAAVPGGGFRQASTALPPAVLQAVDARIAGAPLDAAGEQQALQRHWSR